MTTETLSSLAAAVLAEARRIVSELLLVADKLELEEAKQKLYCGPLSKTDVSAVSKALQQQYHAKAAVRHIHVHYGKRRGEHGDKSHYLRIYVDMTYGQED